MQYKLKRTWNDFIKSRILNNWKNIFLKGISAVKDCSRWEKFKIPPPRKGILSNQQKKLKSGKVKSWNSLFDEVSGVKVWILKAHQPRKTPFHSTIRTLNCCYLVITGKKLTILKKKSIIINECLHSVIFGLHLFQRTSKFSTFNLLILLLHIDH